MKPVETDRTDGKHYHDEETGASVFESTQGETPRFCAWDGEITDYSKASRTPWADTMEKVLEFLKHKNFICEKCGKTRSRHSGKKWSDNCIEPGGHDWEPAPPKKKSATGRKINLWFADTQLEEIEKAAEETGNDRASTIRELVNQGLKFRKQLDKLAGLADKLNSGKSAENKPKK